MYSESLSRRSLEDYLAIIICKRNQVGSSVILHLRKREKKREKEKTYLSHKLSHPRYLEGVVAIYLERKKRRNRNSL